MKTRPLLAALLVLVLAPIGFADESPAPPAPPAPLTFPVQFGIQQVDPLLAGPLFSPPPPIPVGVGRLFNYSVEANTDVLGADIAPNGSATPVYDEFSVTLRVTIALKTTDSVVELQIVDAANAVTVEADLNSGTPLTAGKLYAFEFSAPRWAFNQNWEAVALTYNLQCETATTIGLLVVEEVRGD